MAHSLTHSQAPSRLGGHALAKEQEKHGMRIQSSETWADIVYISNIYGLGTLSRRAVQQVLPTYLTSLTFRCSLLLDS